jgi:hypothetical protein
MLELYSPGVLGALCADIASKFLRKSMDCSQSLGCLYQNFDRVLTHRPDAVRQKAKERRILLAVPSQVPSPSRGQDRLYVVKFML